MPKRSRIIKMSIETKILKEMRLKKRLSQRKTAELLKVSQTVINHSENGRAKITKDYIQHFLTSLNYNWNDWEQYYQSFGEEDELLIECQEALKRCDKEQLVFIYKILLGLNN